MTETASRWGELRMVKHYIAHLEERAEFWEDEYTGARIKIAELEAQCAGLELMLAEGAESEGECEECREYRKLEAAGLALYWKIRHNPDVCGLDEFEDWRNTLAGES